MANGIDVYTKYQNVTDWSAVKRAGYDFAYVKVSDGEANRSTAGWGAKGRAAGVKMGAYHYAQFGDPVAQANRLVTQAIAGGLTDLAPALDIEAPFGADETAVRFAVAFVRQVKARGFRPCLYANNSMMRVLRGPVKAAVPETFIWVARYGGTPTVDFDLWQWSSSGRVPGIAASGVDLNKGAIPLNTNTTSEDDDVLTPDQENKLGSTWAAMFIGGGENPLKRGLVYEVADIQAKLNALADKVATPAPAEVDLDALAAKLVTLAPTIDYAALAKAVNDDNARRMAD